MIFDYTTLKRCAKRRGVSGSMESGSVDRRRGRRAAVQAPLVIRRLGTSESKLQEETATNVSLAGVYFETDDAQAYLANDVVLASVAIPASQRREFPFTRIAGRSRVVRVKELPTEGTSSRRRLGIALEFNEDVTALTAIPGRG